MEKSGSLDSCVRPINAWNHGVDPCLRSAPGLFGEEEFVRALYSRLARTDTVPPRSHLPSDDHVLECGDALFERRVSVERAAEN